MKKYKILDIFIEDFIDLSVKNSIIQVYAVITNNKNNTNTSFLTPYV